MRFGKMRGGAVSSATGTGVSSAAQLAASKQTISCRSTVGARCMTWVTSEPSVKAVMLSDTGGRLILAGRS